ncbi:MAG: flagellar hook-basal body complex protein [Synergistaceae bacterium]|nr:flagellar hook-basal body complex protein [Synergistaceae bacterium]
MLRSLMTAVTGVRAHQTMLDVTGNNISNANTTGFKKDNTIFADLMYQANKYASASGDTRGGINPAQVGLGVSVAAIETIYTQGSGSYTGNASDMMIQDRGFFVYSDGTNQYFSRSGACTLDGNSDMVLSGSGYRLQGYKMEQTALSGFQQAAELSTVNIPIGQKMDAHATSRVDYQCNLDSRSNAYLSYGFADLPFNSVAGANGLSSGRAKVPVNGTEYDMAFTTRFDGDNNLTGTGRNYLDITLANGGETAAITFDMTGIDAETGKPTLSIPRLVYDTTGTTTASSATVVPADTTATAVASGDNKLVGYINLATATAIGSADIAAVPETEVGNYVPVYQLPGQMPPQYAAAQYDDTTGTVRLRTISILDASNNSVSAVTTNTFLQNMATDGTGPGTKIRIDPSAFTYDVKGKMNYTSFTLSGSPTVPVAGGTTYEPARVSYDFLVEFDESVERNGSESELGKTMSKMTLWYYGYSNSDAAGVLAGTATQSMHKLEANVAFNADGSFDYVDWVDTNNDNAPMGYRIVNGTLLGGTDEAGPNFQIVAGTSSGSSTTKNTLNFMQAQSLDTPGAKDSLGVWTTVGAASQGGFHATKATIYDDDGKTHTLEVTFKKVTENRWRWEAFLVEQDESGNDVIANVIPEPRTGEIEFDGSGRISNAIAEGALRSTENAEVAITLPFSLNGQPNSTVTLNFGGGVGSGGDALLGITQFASETTTKPVYQDGYTMGILKNYSVAQDGTITGSYSNGVSIPLYRVALATFANEQGLEKVGNTMFQASVNSGTANIDGAGSNGKGTIMGQYVEMSNVDLTEEFTHLIIAQRGFQANTRVVTVSDQILEEVVNLKR